LRLKERQKSSNALEKQIMRSKKQMTTNISLRLLSIMLLSAFAFVGLSFAQAGGTGSIAVTVTDSTGAIVKGATLTLTNKATNQSQTASTGDDGLHTFVLLQPGNYTLKTIAPSFGDSTLDVEVQVGRTTDAPVALAVGKVSAVVEVTAEGVQTTTSNFDAVQNSNAIQNLPINGRRFQDFVTLTPTAQVDPSRGQISLAGQRGINSNVNVDGVDYNQPFFGGIRGGERSNSAFTLPQEAIREFQVVASGYSAEFGRSSGGIVNAVTKSGTNDLHGSAFLLWRPSDLALPNEFTDALREQKLNALAIPIIIAPDQTQFGGSLGGPIKKNKLFFFTSYEQQKWSIRRAVAQTTLVGFSPSPIQSEPFNTYTAARGPFTQTDDAKAFLGKIDWDINGANRFNIRYNYSKNTALNGVSVGETSLDPTTFRSIETNGIEGDRNNVVVGQLISTLSPRLLNEVRFQWAKEDRPRTANAQQVSVVTNIGELGTRTFLPTTQNDKRYQLMDSMTFTTGSHTLKFGGEYSKIKVGQLFGFNQFGNYTFSGLNATGDILTALSTSGGTFGRFDVSQARFNQQIGNLQAAFNVQELALFGQDAWRVTPKLTINFGLRYEKQFNPAAEANNTPVINAITSASFPLLGGRSVDPTRIPDSKNQWGPRLGFAYDVNGDGRTVLRAYSGIYYARTPAIVLAAPFNNFRTPAGDLSVQLGPGAFNSSTFNQATFDAANPQYVSIVGAGQAPNTVYRQFAILGINLNTFNLTNLPSLTPSQLGTIADRIQAARSGSASPLGVFQNASLIGISPDFQNPVSYQFGGGFEHEWFRNLYIGADFAWIKTIHLERNVDINLPAPSSFDAVTGRPIYIRNNRPVTSLGTIQLRDSSANQLYREVTARMRVIKRWGQINAFYTWSKNESDDDNERDSGGVLYDDPFTRRGEYYASKLDRTHQFVASPLFFLPGGFDVSSSIRLRSGTPLNLVVGSDLNGDNNSGNERPYRVYGVELPRNFYRNRPIYDVDLRVQKHVHLGETARLTFSGEIFNILDRANMQIGQTTASGSPTLYCRNSIEVPGQGAAPPLSRCGIDGITTVNFLQVRDQRQLVNGVTNPNYGKINLLNSPGSQPFQVQIGARLNF
jgi:outer membrane receptor protein involved in Fe transport